jgi:hypothetical protein
MMYIPRVDEDLTITLPGEILRAKVTRVVDRNLVFVLIGQPMTRGHNFRLGDLVACRRTPGVLGEFWQAIEIRPMSVGTENENVSQADVAKSKGRVGKVSENAKLKAAR